MASTSPLILIADDNPDDRLLITRALQRNGLSNEIVAAADGEEALEFIHGTGRHAGRDASQLPQVVLLDLRMPKVDGLDVLKALRAEERTRMLPIVVLTSSDEDRDMVESYRFGANSFVQKPVEFGAFVEAVQQLGLYWVLVNKPPAPPVTG